ncbi:MAG TPA: hypothetical protein VKZ56_02590 [Membranihabitans sp.]|nr:hypothetical protein [Membranihabitans sp.]
MFRKKSDAFPQATNTSKALFLTMITTYEVEQNQYAGIIQNDLKLDMLFRKIM